MSDIKALVERLKAYAKDQGGWHNIDDTCEEAAAALTRMVQENWQLRQACGYPIPADKETPQNPFKCGTCEAARAALEEAAAAIERLTRERDAGLDRAEWLDSELAKADEWRTHNKALREALEHAHDLMFEYGFSSNDLRPVRAALEAKRELLGANHYEKSALNAEHEQRIAAERQRDEAIAALERLLYFVAPPAYGHPHREEHRQAMNAARAALEAKP